MIDGLCIRSVDQDLSMTGDGRTVIGLLAPYNQVAEVNDGFGPYKEMFVPGCFERCIRGNASYLRVQLEHNGHWVGRGQMWRDGPSGLAAVMRLDDTEAGREAAFKIRDGQTPGLSLMYLPIHTEKSSPTIRGVVQRRRVRAIHHVALCQYPAYADAQVASVRSIEGPPRTPDRLAYWQEWTKRVQR